jgi:hypothetical protein
MIAVTTTAKTKTSFQEIFFNDLFPFTLFYCSLNKTQVERFNVQGSQLKRPNPDKPKPI